MDDVPADIEQTATRFAGEYLAAPISCERLYRDVVALLVAERERCVHLTKATAITTPDDIAGGTPDAYAGFYEGVCDARKAIAAAIRSVPASLEE